jgi:predicted alpha/beta-fold hydrolase
MCNADRKLAPRL